MKDRYYSEFISQEFHEKISALRIAKGIKVFEQFEFIFVDSNECRCINVKENRLETIKINDEILTNITNIIVFTYGTYKNFHYTNTVYEFIGIFDIKGNESTINLGCIELNSIGLSHNYTHDKVDITDCNITILHNQFNEYLGRIISPIHKTLSSSLKDIYYCDIPHLGELCSLRKLDNKLTLDIGFNYVGSRTVWCFSSTLNKLKKIEQRISQNLEDTKFDPEITLKQEITFKIKSSEIQFDTNS